MTESPTAHAGPADPLPISVVIPAYNAAAFLGAALESVYAQIWPPTEVIVVDNASTDASGDIARAAGAQVLRLERAGLCLARNAGIRAASQPWIALLDADDLWDPAKLTWQWLAVEKCPQAGLVITDFSEFDVGGPIRPSFLPEARNYDAIDRQEIAQAVVTCDEKSFRTHFLTGNFIAPSTVLARRDLMMEVGLFDEDFSHMEDRELWLRMLPRTTVAVVERPLVHTRIHSGNCSADSLRMSLGIALLAERVLTHPERYLAGAATYYRAERPRSYLNAGRFAEEAGDLRQARRHYLRASAHGGGLRPLALAALSCLPPSLHASARSASRLFMRTSATYRSP